MRTEKVAVDLGTLADIMRSVRPMITLIAKVVHVRGAETAAQAISSAAKSPPSTARIGGSRTFARTGIAPGRDRPSRGSSSRDWTLGGAVKGRFRRSRGRNRSRPLTALSRLGRTGRRFLRPMASTGASPNAGALIAGSLARRMVRSVIGGPARMTSRAGPAGAFAREWGGCDEMPDFSWGLVSGWP